MGEHEPLARTPERHLAAAVDHLERTQEPEREVPRDAVASLRGLWLLARHGGLWSGSPLDS